MVLPTLKWPGGKRQLLDEIHSVLSIAPDHYSRYCEPFLGGGAVAFDLREQPAVLSDLNKRLMNYYRIVANKPELLIAVLQSFDDPDSNPDPYKDFADTTHKGYDVDSYYYQQRALFNNRPYGYEYDRVMEAALLQYLNRTCFNGLYRENQSGGFNVSVGDYDNPDWVQEDRVMALSEYLSSDSVQLRTGGYDKVFNASPGDLIYVDPPYKPVSQTADFTEYTQDGFDHEDQLALVDTLCEWADTGACVVASNSGAMSEIYADAGFEVFDVEGVRSISGTASGRGSTKEILAVNDGLSG